MNKIRKFFSALWDYITFWLPARKLDKKLTKLAEADKKSLITEKDVEFLKNIGIETDLKSLKNGEENENRKL